MKRAFPPAIVLTLVLLNASCGNNDDSSAVSTPGLPNVILPLQDGNFWSYRRTAYDSQGSVIAVDTTTERVARDTLLSGERWYIWQTPSGLSMGTLRSDGYWSLAGGVPALFFVYPASVNQTYMITENGPTIRVIAVDTLISVPRGTFPCIGYEQLDDRSGSLVRIDYLAANTGLIRAEEYVHLPGGADSLARRSDLIDIHLN